MPARKKSAQQSSVRLTKLTITTREMLIACVVVVPLMLTAASGWFSLNYDVKELHTAVDAIRGHQKETTETLAKITTALGVAAPRAASGPK